MTVGKCCVFQGQKSGFPDRYFAQTTARRLLMLTRGRAPSGDARLPQTRGGSAAAQGSTPPCMFGAAGSKLKLPFVVSSDSGASLNRSAGEEFNIQATEKRHSST